MHFWARSGRSGSAMTAPGRSDSGGPVSFFPINQPVLATDGRHRPGTDAIP